jgi:ParB family chromosome partitioning protein
MPIQEISLSKLELSPLNVRKTRTKEDIASMAASIEAHGVLQNLLAHPNGGDTLGVVIGGTRLEAMKLLQSQGKIAADYAVPVEVRPADDATLTERSLSENFRRSAMHPADEFDAFKKLSDDGNGNETIAARFGTTPRLVVARQSR